MKLPFLPGRRRGVRVTAAAVVAALAVAAPAAVIGWTAFQRPTAGSAGPGRPLEPSPGSEGDSTGARACAGQPARAARQLRGMTITTVYNLDWPSRPGLDADAVKAEYRGWLDVAQRLNFNAVFVHIRPSGDAFWPSAYAPWSDWLTGHRDGQSPGWDPLEFMVAETHARNLEFHAWLNPYRGSQPAPQGAGPDLNQLAPTHPLRQHPDWAVVYPVNATGSRLYYNPGIPEARTFVEDSMLDAVVHYDIDGVFFDDFFYPYPTAGQDFPDAAAFARYGGGFAAKGDWRRDNVNRLVEEMNLRIRTIKPWVKFGISPFGIWRNSSSDPLGSPTAGLQSYDEIYADTRLWVRRQWVDFIMPQLYWQIGNAVADYAKLVPWWSAVVSGTRVQLYIAHGDYRVGEPGAWSDPAELDRQLTFDAAYPVSGSVHYSAKDVRADRLGSVTRYGSAHFNAPALVPTMAHLPGTPPTVPAIIAAQRDPTGAVTLTWREGAGPAGTGVAVYRTAGSATTSLATASSATTGPPAGSPAALIASVRLVPGGLDHTWVDRTATNGRAYRYCITVLDRLWNESGASNAANVVA